MSDYSTPNVLRFSYRYVVLFFLLFFFAWLQRQENKQKLSVFLRVVGVDPDTLWPLTVGAVTQSSCVRWTFFSVFFGRPFRFLVYWWSMICDTAPDRRGRRRQRDYYRLLQIPGPRMRLVWFFSSQAPTLCMRTLPLFFLSWGRNIEYIKTCRYGVRVMDPDTAVLLIMLLLVTSR